MIRALALLLPLLFTSSLFAQRIVLNPPAPTSADDIRVTVMGVWGDGCVPANPTLERSGNTIVITLHTPRNVGCTLALARYESTVFVGKLDPGAYDVRVRIDQPLLVGLPEQRALLFVRDAAPSFRVTPDAVSNRGGTEVMLTSTIPDPLSLCGNTCEQVRVRFGDTVVEADEFSDHLKVRVPALSAGPVDVQVESPRGTRTARAAVYAFDPEAPLEQTLHSTTLFPLYFNGPGAFGSQWETIAEISNRSRVAMTPLRPVTPTIASGATTALDASLGLRERGVLFHPPRSLAGSLGYAAFVRDRSRDAERWGTEIPVVREENFTTRLLDFPHVPNDPRYRVTLRVYFLDAPRDTVLVDVVSRANSNARVFFSMDGQKRDDLEPGFAIMENLTARLQNAPAGPMRVTLRSNYEVTRFWGFLTVTNNETQQVTVITPQ